MIEVLLATYNGEKYIEEQLDSILNQTFNDFRIIANDDCSDDKTYELLKRYKKKYPKIFEISQVKCGGSIKNFFYLMSKSRADIVMFSDQDDIWINDKINNTYKEYKKIENSENPCLVYSDLEVINSRKEEIANSFMKMQRLVGNRNKPAQLVLRNVVSGSTIMCNRRCIELALKAKDLSKVAMHDWWLALIASEFGEIRYLDKKMVKYRQHENNVVGAKLNRGLNWFVSEVFNICSIKESLKRTRVQSEYFGQTYNKEFYIEYGKLMNRYKLYRIKFYIKYGVLFQDLIENIGLFMIG